MTPETHIPHACAALCRIAAPLHACSYRASSSIPLVDVFFEVRAATPGPARGAVSLSPGAAALLPSWAGAPHQFASWDGPGASGSLNVSAAAPLGAWAWAQQADLFNTALLTGQAVSLALRGVGISSYGSMDVDAGGPVTCGLLAAAGGASAAVSLDAARCVLQVDAVNSVPAKGLAVLVTAGASSAQVTKGRVRLCTSGSTHAATPTTSMGCQQAPLVLCNCHARRCRSTCGHRPTCP